MRVTADTNVILRAIIGDDPAQADAARRLLDTAELVVVTTPTLCELVWVLRHTYRQKTSDIANVIRGILETANMVVNVTAARAGLTVLDAGGDFADGVIAFEGELLGGELFVTFDREAHSLISRSGLKSRLLAT